MQKQREILKEVLLKKIQRKDKGKEMVKEQQRKGS